MGRGAYDTSMTHTANKKNASRNKDVTVPPKAKELHPKVIPALRRQEASLSQSFRQNEQETDPQHNLNEKEGHDDRLHEQHSSESDGRDSVQH